MAGDDIAERLLIEEYKSCRELIAKNIDIMEKNGDLRRRRLCRNNVI